MRAKEFIVERKKKRRVRGAAYGPGPYGLYGVNTGYSGDGGVSGDGGSVGENVHEEPTAHRIRVTVTDPNAEANVRTKEVQKTVRVTADDPRNAIKMARDYFVKKGYRVHDHHYIGPVGVEENFADGENPGRKGLSKRVGIPKKSTLGQLEKIASSSTGERRRMAQWQLNMRRGKKK